MPLGREAGCGKEGDHQKQEELVCGYAMHYSRVRPRRYYGLECNLMLAAPLYPGPQANPHLIHKEKLIPLQKAGRTHHLNSN